MDLEEKRAVHAFRDEQLPALRDDIEAATGFPVDVEVDWESLTEENVFEPDRYADAFTMVYFQPLVDGFGEVCTDELGRDALEAGLDRVVLKNDEGYWNRNGVSFADGVLTIDHEPSVNVDHVDERTDAVVDALNGGL